MSPIWNIRNIWLRSSNSNNCTWEWKRGNNSDIK